MTGKTKGNPTMKRQLLLLLRQHAESDGQSDQQALRDLLFDLWHVARELDLDLPLAFDKSEEAFDKQERVVHG